MGRRRGGNSSGVADVLNERGVFKAERWKGEEKKKGEGGVLR